MLGCPDSNEVFFLFFHIAFLLGFRCLTFEAQNVLYKLVLTYIYL